MRPTVMEKQEMICRIGELAEEIFVLKSGEAQIFHPPSARAGRAAPLKVMQSGSSFGEESMLGRQRYEFTARTRHAGTVLYLIQADQMTKLLAAFPVRCHCVLSFMHHSCSSALPVQYRARLLCYPAYRTTMPSLQVQRADANVGGMLMWSRFCRWRGCGNVFGARRYACRIYEWSLSSAAGRS